MDAIDGAPMLPPPLNFGAFESSPIPIRFVLPNLSIWIPPINIKSISLAVSYLFSVKNAYSALFSSDRSENKPKLRPPAPKSSRYTSEPAAGGLGMRWSY